MKPKILIYDLEVSPTLGWVYGLYDVNVIKIEQQPIIMCFSYRWYGEDKTYNVRMKSWTNLAESEKAVVNKLWEIMDKADIVVAHNANGFDNKVATAAFLRHNFTPPSPYKSIDTLRVARGVAKFNSNSLDSLCDLFGIGRKSDIKHSDLWYDCLHGVCKAWKLMVEYNNQDVDLLYKLYEKLRPYVRNHPNVAAYMRKKFACTYCGSDNLQSRGLKTFGTGTFAFYWCRDCGHNPRNRIADKDIGRPQLI